MTRLIDENTIIKMLNTMDRYTSEELTLCDTDKTFPKNEVFVVDDVYEGLGELPSTQLEQQWISVKDRLPQFGEEVIVRPHNGQTGLYSFWKVEEHDYWLPDLFDAIRRPMQLDKLDWWMPIPEWDGDGS